MVPVRFPMGRAGSEKDLPLSGLCHPTDRLVERPEVRRRRRGRRPNLPPIGRVDPRQLGPPPRGVLFIDQRDGAEIAQERDRLPGQPARDRFVVERPDQHGARLGEECRAPRRLLGRGAGRLRPGQCHMFFRLSLDLLGHLVQLDEHPDLGPEDLRYDGGQDVVDRSQRVSLRRVHLVAESRDENDRRVRRLAAAPDHGGRLQPVHVRHVDVEENDREFRVEQVPQRLSPRPGLHQVLAQSLQDRVVDQELFLQVVHHQDVDLLVVHHLGPCALSHYVFRPCVQDKGLEDDRLSDAATRGARTATAPYRRAWRDSPRHPPRYTSRGLPSWPSR